MVDRRRALRGPDLGAAGALEHWFGAAAWGLAIFDVDHRFLRVNPALCALLMKREERHWKIFDPFHRG